MVTYLGRPVSYDREELRRKVDEAFRRGGEAALAAQDALDDFDATRLTLDALHDGQVAWLNMQLDDILAAPTIN